jgi:hypothetical protein
MYEYWSEMDEDRKNSIYVYILHPLFIFIYIFLKKLTIN